MTKRLLLPALAVAAILSATLIPALDSSATGTWDPSFSCEYIGAQTFICEGVYMPGITHSWSASGNLTVSQNSPIIPIARVTCWSSGTSGSITHTITDPYGATATASFRLTCPQTGGFIF